MINQKLKSCTPFDVETLPQDPMIDENLREQILGTVDDLVSKFLYYDRKEDEDLPRGQIEKAVEEEIITVEEIVKHFRERLKIGLGIEDRRTK